MQRTAFVSHASQDAVIAGKVVDYLEKAGISCWLAPRDVTPGQEYGREIIRGINQCTAIVLVLSENANESRFVKREIERGVSLGKAIFPVRVREVLPSESLELFISGYHWIDAWRPPIEQYLGHLATAIRAVANGEQGLDSSPAPPPPPGASGHRRRALPLVASVLGVLVLGVTVALFYPFALPSMDTEPDQTVSAATASEPASSTTVALDDTGDPSSPPQPQQASEGAGYEQVIATVGSQEGLRRYNTLRTLQPHFDGSLSSDQLLALAGDGPYRLRALLLFKDKLQAPLDIAEYTRLATAFAGLERYNLLRELEGHAPGRMTPAEVLAIVEDGPYRYRFLQQFKDRLPDQRLTHADLLLLLGPVQGLEKYNTLRLLSGKIPRLSLAQVNAVAGDDAYSDRIRNLLLEVE